ncbi:MAG: GNAT family N-acetyltransferase, partial [Planctomycetales bacterium]|nr:GNAT family N-acetyltransferase [Planctomycetales bacterium]
MYRLRHFSNLDTPHLVDVWKSQPALRGIANPIRAWDFEQLVLSRQYFDRAGLIVAQRDGEIVGFAHGGFGPDEANQEVDTSWGVTAMLMVRPEEHGSSLGAELLAASEEYLRGRGAKVLYAGCVRPLNPFYQGLYGGSEMPGTLESDTFRLELYRNYGY